MPVNAQKVAPMLNSWKEIGLYLNRGVRTVQRWEHELQLPVHRVGKGRRSPVYALVPELRFWLATTGAAHSEAQLKPDRDLDSHERSRNLISQFRSLVQAVAENTVRQRRQAELLEKKILEIRARMK
jgi:hypothetical protein